MNKLYIGIDNGTSGTLGAVCEGYSDFVLTPVKTEQNYTKKKAIVSRIDVDGLIDWLRSTMEKCSVGPENTLAILERPLINPGRFEVSVLAARAFEATLVVLEYLKIPHMYTDSKEWQKNMLPKGTTGSPELKKASMDVGIRLYPQFEELIRKHKDADGVLIAYNAYREKY